MTNKQETDPDYYVDLEDPTIPIGLGIGDRGH